MVIRHVFGWAYRVVVVRFVPPTRQPCFVTIAVCTHTHHEHTSRNESCVAPPSGLGVLSTACIHPRYPRFAIATFSRTLTRHSLDHSLSRSVSNGTPRCLLILRSTCFTTVLQIFLMADGQEIRIALGCENPNARYLHVSQSWIQTWKSIFY
jgi:hypothetical protein